MARRQGMPKPEQGAVCPPSITALQADTNRRASRFVHVGKCGEGAPAGPKRHLPKPRL